MSPDAAPATAPIRHLFRPLLPEATTALAGYPALLRRALGLTPGRERELPWRIRDLSLSLTAERDGGPKPGYLSEPRTLAAYAWYFLPWNLLRLSRLLPGLDLDLPDGGLVCDLGSGPLTFVQALWLSRPDLRRKRLRFTCVDRSRRALDLGQALFTGLAGFDPTTADAPWRIRTVRGEYWQGLADGAQLTTMVNVANELAESGREPLDLRMERLAGQLADSLAPGGRALVVEPGTRLGWRCLAAMRTALVEMGLGLAAPCPHGEECPFSASKVRAWCHFNISLAGAPAWLTTLSDKAELGKQRLSLSFLMARAAPPEYAAQAVRIVSGPFSLNDAPGAAVYGCTEKGLAVVVAPDGRAPRPGDLLIRDIPQDAPRDAKSGAPRIILDAQAVPAPKAAPDTAAVERSGAKPPRRRPQPGTGSGVDRPAMPKRSARPAKSHSGTMPGAKSTRRSGGGKYPGSGKRSGKA
ncbi:Ribosomal small subunit Rsm22 [Solidesulfovibrio fructosivorans JJ]]|uniref:Ribosomal small subunit Rsm22 n=1 Tax=Solidesulfovibrio fructosivorans JJ] TaxID=596151 RepID=E1K1E4_SOLFR|nr:small ribosomal subunit Rsm22 family protein [Solidesulfovibrio fructosivorans]EFL49559.1 Ribosomal small subunit Rsm22 [Solidesulfovibrio fructosivorans JJ]]